MLETSDTLQALQMRIWALLPGLYQDRSEDVLPVSMGTAGLKYGADGLVAWDQIWGSFCDLAMAGGPPHKGHLLEPASYEAIAANPEGYRQVTAEICRAIALVTGLAARTSHLPGWIAVDCSDATMAGWLVRAIVMENVSASAEGATLLLPAGPDYRVAKEIKNVVTSIAKTTHYFVDHVWPAQRCMITSVFEEMAETTPLLQPDFEASADSAKLRQILATAIPRETGLAQSDHAYDTWSGFVCADVATAIWLMRALVATNVLARREETTVFVPLDSTIDPDGERLIATFTQLHGFAATRLAQ